MLLPFVAVDWKLFQMMSYTLKLYKKSESFILLPQAVLAQPTKSLEGVAHYKSVYQVFKKVSLFDLM